MTKAIILFVFILTFVSNLDGSEKVEKDVVQKKQQEEADSFLEQIKKENDGRRNDGTAQKLWTALLDNRDIDPEETYKLVADLYLTYVDPKSPDRKNLGALLSLLSIDYGKCDVPNVPSESLDKSWLTNPKIARFVDHYRKLKEDGCSWLAMSPEERLAEAIPNEFECQTKSHNFREIFLNSRAVLARPESCSEESQQVAEKIVDMVTCSGSGCCSIVDETRNIHIYIKFSLDMEKSVKKSCINWIQEELVPIVTRLKQEVYSIASQPSSIENAIKPVFSKLGKFAKKRVKLEQLNQLYFEPCKSILGAISKVEDGLELVTYREQIEYALSKSVRKFQKAWNWCSHNMDNIESMLYTSKDIWYAH